MGYVTKQKNHLETLYPPPEDHCSAHEHESHGEFYRVFIVELITDDTKVYDLEIRRSKQVRIQFLYREKEQLDVDKFLVLIHHECEQSLIVVLLLS